MKKTNLITIILVIVAILFSGCSDLGKSQERLDNEAKMIKFAENLGVSEEETLNRLKNMTDEEISKAAMMINDKGKIDTSKIFDEVEKEQDKETNELIKNAELKEIKLDCSDKEDSIHMKEGSLIELKGIGKTLEGNDISMNNLEGEIEIKIYNVKYEYNKNSYGKEFKKGNLIDIISGKIDDIMDLEKSSSLLGINYKYTYLVKFSNLDKSKLGFNKKYFDEEYEYNYIRYPIWVDITYKQNNKEYRDVLIYGSYNGCEIYEMVAQIDSNEPNNEIAHKKKYLKNIKVTSYQIEEITIPASMYYKERTKYKLSGGVLNSGIENIKNLKLKVDYLDENKKILRSKNYEILSTLYDNKILSVGQISSFNISIDYDIPISWNKNVEVSISEIEFEE